MSAASQNPRCPTCGRWLSPSRALVAWFERVRGRQVSLRRGCLGHCWTVARMHGFTVTTHTEAL